MTNSPKEYLNLNEIEQERNRLLTEIRHQKASITERTRALFDPPKSNTRMEMFMNNFDRALAIYDGLMLGLRLMRQARHFVRRRK